MFVVLGLAGKGGRSDLGLIAMVTVGLVGYELAQGPVGAAVDPCDGVATLVAGAFCLGLYAALHGWPSREREGG